MGRPRNKGRSKQDRPLETKARLNYPATSSNCSWSTSKFEYTFCTSSVSSRVSSKRIIWLAAGPSLFQPFMCEEGDRLANSLFAITGFQVAKEAFSAFTGGIASKALEHLFPVHQVMASQSEAISACPDGSYHASRSACIRRAHWVTICFHRQTSKPGEIRPSPGCFQNAPWHWASG